MLSLEDVEQKIYSHYRWFAAESPGTQVQEAGILAQWWSIADRYYGQEQE